MSSADVRVFDLATTPIERGTTVIEASAGTGKTYCLVGLVLRLLLEERVESIDRLLVVTFTVAATEELVTRVREGLEKAEQVLAGELDAAAEGPLFVHLKTRHGPASERGDKGLQILRQARLELDELAVSTIHGFARRVLDERAFETGLPFEQELLDNAEPILLRAARDFWRHRLYPAPSVVTAVARARRLEPTSFLGDFATWRRHPATELLPPPVSLERAGRVLAEQRELLATLATPETLAALRRTLEGLRFKKGKELPAEVSEQYLDALAAIGDRLDTAALAAVETFAAPALEQRIYKKDWTPLAEHPVLTACETMRRAVDELVHSLRGAFLDEVAERFEAEKQRLGQMTFDDLLRRLDTALDDPRRGGELERALGGHYQAALIDEFQDTDLLQYKVFHRLFGHRLLVLIGDPKQAIYRFRGADVFAYMEARSQAERRYTLGQNWRSEQGLVEAVNTLFGAGPEPFVFEEIPFLPTRAAERPGRSTLEDDGGRPLEWLWLEGEKNKVDAEAAVCRAVRREIAGLLAGDTVLRTPGEEDRPLEPGHIAILVRTNAQAHAMRRALEEIGIPAVLSQAGDVFLSEEMVELERVLAALAEPRDARRLRTAVTTRIWGGDDARLRSLIEDDRAWQDLLERALGYRSSWQLHGFMPMMRQLLDELDIESRWLAEQEGERRITNLLHAVELLHRASHEQHLSPAGLVAWLAGERRRHLAGQGDGEGTELRLESDAEAVQVVTIHKSKGLEYELVFCPYLWQGRPVRGRPPIEAQRDPRHRVLDFGGEDFERHRAQAEAERMAEDLRLAYVALTRARHRSVVVWGEHGRPHEAGASALAHLLYPWIAGSPPREPEETPAQRVARRSKTMSAAFGTWETALRRLVEAHGDIMSFEAPITAPSERSVAPPVAPELRARHFPEPARQRLRPWRLTSFTNLARSAGHDAAAKDAAVGDASGLDPGDARDRTDPPAAESPLARPAGPARGLFAFARGSRPGQCLHTVLEACDLERPESESNQRRVEEILQRFGLARREAHRRGSRPLAEDFDPAGVLLEMLRTVAFDPVPGAGFRLGEIDPAARLVEWQFHLPLDGFPPHRLAELFEPDDPEYANHLAALGTVETGPGGEGSIEGFLTGFVDLAWVHAGRWYLLDWKSNHLGDRFEDYRRDRLREVMVSHHYLLQYHLYALALYRHLRHRQPGWDYDRDFGGVIYVFLRGLRPGDQEPSGEPETTGWWLDKPPVERIEALDRLAGGEPISEGDPPPTVGGSRP